MRDSFRAPDRTRDSAYPSYFGSLAIPAKPPHIVGRIFFGRTFGRTYSRVPPNPVAAWAA